MWYHNIQFIIIIIRELSVDLFIGITWRKHKVSRDIASLDTREVEKKITVNRKMLALVTYECPLTSLAHISYICIMSVRL